MTSSSSPDEPDTKKIKTDCDEPEKEEEKDEKNVPQPVKRREAVTILQRQNS